MQWALRKRSAKAGIPFNLTCDDLLEAFPKDGRCPVLGMTLVFGPNGSRGNRTNASVDRTIPRLGYVRGNISIVSMRANSIKQDASASEVARVAAWMAAMESKAAQASPPS